MRFRSHVARFALPLAVLNALGGCLVVLALSLPGGSHAQAEELQDQAGDKQGAEKQDAVVAPPAKLIEDANLEAALRNAVYEKRGSKEPLTEDDLRKVFVLEADGKDIADLRGLQFCRNLHLLKLSHNKVRDLTPLADLPRLQSLDLEGNQVSDLSPLAKDTALQYLQLAGNEITDVAPLAELKKLSALYLSNNKLQDLTPLAGLTKLSSLYLDHNEISDISPLRDANGLTSLDLSGNKVADLSALDQQRQLRYLLLESNRLTDLASLVKIIQADAAGSRNLSPFLNLYLAGNPLTDAAKGEQAAALSAAGVRVHLEPATAEK